MTVNGPGDITITGTARVINSHLSTLTYTPNPGFYGIDTFIMTSTNTCFLTDVDSFNITVTQNCEIADNTTSTASITENETKTLTGAPAGGTWSIVSVGGSITNGIYTPDNINTNTDVTIRYTVTADGTCSETSDDITFTVTPVCDVVADNTTTTASITENETKTLTGAPAGGTWSIVSGGGSINNGVYTPDNINTETTVVIRYTIAADGDCVATTDDVTFTVTPVCDVIADNTTTTASITENETKTLTGAPAGGTFTIVSGGGSINNGVYTPDNINTNTTVVIRYTIAADGDCAATSDDITFTVIPLGSIGDTVWYDENEDGVIDSNEPRLQGATVTLDPGTPSDSSDDVTTTTDVNGNYLFENLPQGNYTVTVNINTISNGLPSGVSIGSLFQTYDNDGTTSANTSSLTLGLAEDNLDQDFGYKENSNLGSIGNTVWFDENGDGNIDSNEQGLEGATVTLDPGTPNDSSDDLTTTTDANGNYLFTNLVMGHYIISVDVSTVTGGLPAGNTPADLIQTYDYDSVGTQNYSAINLAQAEDNLDQDFGYKANNGLGSIGDTVWFDTDGDAILDTGEPRLEGATVTLDPGTPGNSSDDVTTTTDANGFYLFTDLPAGTYTITLDVTTITNGIPSGKTPADLIQTFDFDSVGTPNTSTVSIAQGESNLDQDFAYSLSTGGGTTGGNDGGVESESLGDAISKIYVGRKKNSEPTVFVKDKSNLFNKSLLQAKQPYQGKGQTMLDMFPTELIAGNVANVTSPTDILDYTIADEVLSVDFSLNGETKGVVLGIKTSDKVYNHTKASCDRLRGAEILNIQKIKVAGYDFLMQGIKQRNGVVEYAISFAAAKNNNDDKYSIQTNWYVNNYTKFNDMYNFQVWSTNPKDTQKLVADIIKNLTSFIPVAQTEEQKFPETYASKIFRDKGELVVQLRSTKNGNTANVDMVELYSETANNIKHRNSAVATKIQQDLRFDIADGYEYDALIKVDNEVEDAFYHADGNWGLDYDKRYTTIQEYFVWNDFDREYKDDEYTINRSVEIKAESDYDYLTIYKSLLPGTISADYSEYKYLAFTAKGSGVMELGLIKSSIQEWKEQYRIMVDLSEEEQTYYIPFEAFTSVGTQETITADDLTTLTFTFLPVEANTTKLDLFISDVKFTKVAVEELIVNKVEKFENEFVAYPNPSKGNVNLLLFSKTDTQAEVTLTDMTGKVIYKGKNELTTGKNELSFSFNSLKTGMYLLKVASKESNYGTSKILFRR